MNFFCCTVFFSGICFGKDLAFIILDLSVQSSLLKDIILVDPYSIQRQWVDTEFIKDVMMTLY